MNHFALLRSALWAQLRNWTRSLLTVLDITIGIAAVICVVAIGNADQARVQQQMDNLGNNLVLNRVHTATHAISAPTLRPALAIKNQVSTVSLHVDAQTQVVYGNQNWFTSYRGVAPEYFASKRWSHQLLGGEDPIGKVSRVTGFLCKVVATLQAKGVALSGQDQDDTFMLPYTTTPRTGVATG
jgi:putative ABC transport system permease protein